MGLFSKAHAQSTADVRDRLAAAASELHDIVNEVEKTLIGNVTSLATRTQPPRTIEAIQKDEVCHRCPLLKAYLKEQGL